MNRTILKCALLTLKQIIFDLEYILRTRKRSYIKINFLNKFEIFWYFRPISVFETTANIKTCKFTVFYSGSFCQSYKVTDEALIAETMVWPNFSLMNVFFALKGSKLYIIISYHCSWMLCRVAAVKSLPALIYEGHSRINDNEFISRKVLLESVCFVMSYEDTYITYLCLTFGAFIMASFDAMII